MTEPLVHLITIHWRNLDATKEFLSSFRKVNYKNLRLTLVNNDPIDFPDELTSIISNINVLNNFKNVGFAKGMNQGIQYALDNNAAFIMPINNDTVMDPNAISTLIEHCIENPDTTTSPITLKYGTNKIDNTGIQCLFALGIFYLLKKHDPKKIHALSGACFIASRAQFEKIGLFDEDYFAFAEDIDWSYRARKLGFRLAVFPKSKIWHKHSISTTEGAGWGPIKFYYIARNTLIFAKKNLIGLKKLYFMLIYIFLGGPLHLLFFCRSFSSLRAYFKGLFSGISNKKQSGSIYE